MSTASSSTNASNKDYQKYLAIREEIRRMSSHPIPIKSQNSNRIPCKPLKKPISIIIYAYSMTDYIQECLDSIEKQSYFIDNNNYEIIIGIDECVSTFIKLQEIQHKYRNIKIHQMNEHRGIYITLNTLLDKVKYDNILYFNGDDIMKPEMIEEILKYTDEYDIVKFDYQDFDEEIIDIINNKFWFNNGIFLFNKHVIELTGGYKNWMYAADIELFERVSNFVKVKQLNEILFYKRQHEYDLKINENKKLKKTYDKIIKDNKKIKNVNEIKIDKIIDKKKEDIKIQTTFAIKNIKNIKKHTFYLTRNIPKKIFFCWGGEILSWMRYMTLYSFKKMNPDWEVTLYIFANNIKNKGWKSHENQDYYNYTGNNYFNLLKNLNINIQPAKFPEKIQEKIKNLSPVHKSDIFRHYKLYEQGGFYCDTDVLFFRPIDDFYNEIIKGGYDTIIHEYQSTDRTLTIGFLGASINNEYYKNLFEFGVNEYINKDKNVKIEDNYQSLGVKMIYRMFTGHSYASEIYNDIVSKYPYLKFYNLSTSLIYKFDWTKIEYCFTNSLNIDKFDKDSIGYHWYGGGIESQYYNNILNEKNYKDHNITFSIIADEIINMNVDKKGYVILDKIKKPEVSIVMSTFNRSELLNLGLSSITKQKINYSFEVIVVNDGLDDDGTKNVCDSYKDKLNIKYIFSGYRNSKEKLISRNPAMPLNIGIKHAQGNIIILTCPEIYHLNDGINKIIEPLIKNDNYLVIPEVMYFDDSNYYTGRLIREFSPDKYPHLTKTLDEYLKDTCSPASDHVKMPFLMGITKQRLLDIGGYDEDLIGYACDDNDLLDRLKLAGAEYHMVDAKIIHLYHGKRATGFVQWDNPAWAYNYNLYLERKGILVRNIGKDWGKYTKISIVTAYYNRKELFYRTLKSIEKSKFKDFELIVVDDGSSSEHRLEEYLSEFSFLKIIRIEPKDKWYVNPCIPFNMGIRAAVGEIIILQNPECLHVHDVLTYVNENLKENDYLTMSTFSLDNQNTKILPQYVENNTVMQFISTLPQYIATVSAEEYIGWYNHSKYRPVYFHFCAAMTKKNMQKLNGFDERFAKGIGFDDNDFIQRIDRLGLNKIIVDDITVLHQYHPHVYYKRDDFIPLHNKNKNILKITKKERKYKAN
jgi:glycosyltransferase involved in cell wall biosynthesis